MPTRPAVGEVADPEVGPEPSETRSGWFPKLDPETRKRAIEAPGPSWREWFYRSFLKAYGVLGLFILDAILAAYWLEIPNLAGLGVTLLPALYFEFLLYQFLWHEPHVDALRPSRSTRLGPSARRSWVHPFPFGRWSVTAQQVRRGMAPSPSDGEPDPHEFL